MTAGITIAAQQQAAIQKLPAPSLNAILPQHCIFSSSFSQEQIIQDIPKPITSQGQLFYDCDRGLIWHIKNPKQQTMIYGKKAPHYRVTIDDQPEIVSGRAVRQMARLLNSLMSADEHALSKQFEAKPNPEQSEQFILTPKRKRTRKFIQQIILTKHSHSVNIDIINNEVESIHIVLTNLQHTEQAHSSWCQKNLSSDTACSLLQQTTKNE